MPNVLAVRRRAIFRAFCTVAPVTHPRGEATQLVVGRSRETRGRKRGGWAGAARAGGGQQRLTACSSPPGPAAVDPLTAGDVMRSAGVQVSAEPPPPPI